MNKIILQIIYILIFLLSISSCGKSKRLHSVIVSNWNIDQVTKLHNKSAHISITKKTTGILTNKRLSTQPKKIKLTDVRWDIYKLSAMIESSLIITKPNYYYSNSSNKYLKTRSGIIVLEF